MIMSAEIFFSIVTIVLNDPDGLRTTADSVVSQSSDNFEWIIIDGGSCDSTSSSIEQLESVKNIVHRGADKGIYDAMNKGIDVSSGEYLIFMNAGDEFSGSSILSSIEAFVRANNSVDVVLGGTYERVKECVFYRAPKNIRWIESGLPSFHQSTVYRAELMRDGDYNLRYPLLADYEYLARLCVSGINVGYLNMPVSYFSVGGASYKNIKQKYIDLFSVKSCVLGKGKVFSALSSILAIIKTLLVMNVLYRVCGLYGFRRKYIRVKDERSGVDEIEYYLHGE